MARNTLSSRLGTNRKTIKLLQYMLAYTVLWLCCAAVICVVFRINGRSFIWKSDGVSQHFIAFNYLCEYVEDLFYNHQFRGFFNYSIGQGMDILQTLNSYDFTDPISFVAAMVFPLGRVQRYTLMVFLKLYLIGISFMVFCFSTERKKMPAVLAGAIAYTFSGAVLFTVARHPNYINWAYFFPLILSGVELLERKGKRAPLILFVALNLITNYYTFYMNTVLVAVYLLAGSACRCLRCEQEGFLKEECRRLLHIVLVYAVGVALSAFILLPSIYAFLNNYRVGIASGYTESLLHYEWEYYFKLPESLFAMNYEAGYYTELGLNAASFLPLVLLFCQRGKNTELKSLLVVSCVMIYVPLAGRIMNGFGYASNRWCYAVPFYAGVALTEMFDALPGMSRKERTISVFVLAGYSLVCMLTCLLHSGEQKRLHIFSAVVLVLGINLLLLLVFKHPNDLKRISFLVLGVVFLCGTIQCYEMFSRIGGNYVRSYLEQTETASIYQDYSSVAVKGLPRGFFRTEEGDQESGDRVNHDGYHNINGTSFYWSMYPVSIFEYYRDLGLSSVLTNCWLAGLSGRTGLLELAGVKYYTKPASSLGTVPYGYQEIASGHPEYQVYENPYALPIAYTYSSYITEDEYDALDGLEKEQALLQAAVLPGMPDSTGLEHVKPVQNAQLLGYEITETDGVRLESGRLSANRKGTILLMVEDVPEDCELYLYFRGIQLESILDSSARFDSDYSVKITACRETKGLSSEKNTRISNSNYQWPVLRDDVAFNLGCGPSGESSIRITFDKSSEFTVEAIEVIAVPMSAYSEYAQALREYALEDAEVGADRVAGFIAVPETRILQFSVSYSSGWTAYLDGEKTEALRSDIMYMSVIVPEGEHQVELVYQTPGLRTGLMISAVTLVIWLGFECFNAQRRRQFGL